MTRHTISIFHNICHGISLDFGVKGCVSLLSLLTWHTGVYYLCSKKLQHCIYILKIIGLDIFFSLCYTGFCFVRITR